MDAEELVNEITRLPLPEEERAAWQEQLSPAINHLLLHDFPRLVQLLYRIDVSEKTLSETLKKNPGSDAANLIAGLIWQRQAEKWAARNSHNISTNESDEERW